MIHEALAYIRRELRDRLPVADSEVMIESARALAGQNNNLGAYITLVNVEEEPTLRNLPTVERIGGALLRQEPPVHLNLYLLFSFEFQTYETSLLHLSNTIGLFQEKRVYTAANASAGNPLPADVMPRAKPTVRPSATAAARCLGCMATDARSRSISCRRKMARTRVTMPVKPITPVRMRSMTVSNRAPSARSSTSIV